MQLSIWLNSALTRLRYISPPVSSQRGRHLHSLLLQTGRDARAEVKIHFLIPKVKKINSELSCCQLPAALDQSRIWCDFLFLFIPPEAPALPPVLSSRAPPLAVNSCLLANSGSVPPRCCKSQMAEGSSCSLRRTWIFSHTCWLKGLCCMIFPVGALRWKTEHFSRVRENIWDFEDKSITILRMKL